MKILTNDQIILTAPSRWRVLGGPVKRAFDIVGASFLLIFFAPLFILTAIALKISDPGPLFFAQTRVGFGGTRFKCFKFRTMVQDAEAVLAEVLKNDPKAAKEWAETQKLRNDVRITRIGHFLRQTSLDEVPQLINVLRGEMSLVGPRPIVEGELHHYGKRAENYRAARPGLTGLWQVSGRSNTSYRRRVCLDVHYVSNWSLFFDVLILLKTVNVVLLRKGSV